MWFDWGPREIGTHPDGGFSKQPCSRVCADYEKHPQIIDPWHFWVKPLGSIHKNLMDILATQLWDTPLNTLHGTNTFPIPNALFWVDDFPFPKVGYVEFPGGYIEQRCFFQTSPIAESKKAFMSNAYVLYNDWCLRSPKDLLKRWSFFLFPAIRFLTILEKGMSFTNFTHMHWRYSIYKNSVYTSIFFTYAHIIVHVFPTKNMLNSFLMFFSFCCWPLFWAAFFFRAVMANTATGYHTKCCFQWSWLSFPMESTCANRGHSHHNKR